MKKILALAASHGVAILLGVLAVSMFAGHCATWNKQQALETVPRVLEQTKEAKKAERQSLTKEEVLALCGGLQVIQKGAGGKPNPKAHKESDPSGSLQTFDLGEPALLDEVKVPSLPYGGEARVELSQGAERPSVTVTPNAKPWLEGMSRWRISALVAKDLTGGQSGVLTVPSLDWTGLRTGRITHGASVSYCPAKAVLGGYRVGFE